MSTNKKNKPRELSMADLERITFDAMRHCGMTPPLTVEEVEAIEAELPHINLPFRPTDPRELLQRLEAEADVAATVLQFPQTKTDSARNLARAAREGGTLSTEVEQRMAEDKAKYLRSEHGDQ